MATSMQSPTITSNLLVRVAAHYVVNAIPSLLLVKPS